MNKDFIILTKIHHLVQEIHNNCPLCNNLFIIEKNKYCKSCDLTIYDDHMMFRAINDVLYEVNTFLPKLDEAYLPTQNENIALSDIIAIDSLDNLTIKSLINSLNKFLIFK